MDNGWNQKDDVEDREPALATGTSGAFGAVVIGLVAALVFVAMSLILMVVGYSYGALLDFSPEYPFMLSLPFMLGALVVVVAFPIVGLSAGRAELGLIRMRTAIATGAGFGAASMAIVWLVTSGPGSDPFDWPELLYLLQLTLSGITAGMILFAGLAFQNRRVKGLPGSAGIDPARHPGRGVRVALITALMCLFAMSLPFLLMWQARRSFSEEAQQQASEYFRLPAGFSMSIAPESSGSDSLEKNVHFKATGVQDVGGRTFSVDVIGERRDYDFDIREISASLWAPATDIPAGAPWDDSGEGRRTQEAVLDLAGAYTSSPLEIVSVQQPGLAGKSILMRGDGLEVVARPGGSSPEAPGVSLAFTARPR
ncbi:MAG: hypothetical protein HZB44_10615 [Actinobacteria bacterium]|nr:hypothetical protein [Actinomycetota bacterium]